MGIDVMTIKAKGFADLGEFLALVAAVDISTPAKRAAFKRWQAEDGTKEGLLALEEGEQA